MGTIKTMVQKTKYSFIVNALFLLQLILQVMDLHSTLTASAGRYEVNEIINWMANHVGFPFAVFIMKLCSALVLVFLYSSWVKSKGSHTIGFIISLSLLCVVYGFIVFNNYLH